MIGNIMHTNANFVKICQLNFPNLSQAFSNKLELLAAIGRFVVKPQYFSIDYTAQSDYVRLILSAAEISEFILKKAKPEISTNLKFHYLLL